MNYNNNYNAGFAADDAANKTNGRTIPAKHMLK